MVFKASSLGAALLLASALAAQPGDGVTLKLVNYQQLGDAVRPLRGKVVVVDFWADT